MDGWVSSARSNVGEIFFGERVAMPPGRNVRRGVYFFMLHSRDSASRVFRSSLCDWIGRTELIFLHSNNKLISGKRVELLHTRMF